MDDGEGQAPIDRPDMDVQGQSGVPASQPLRKRIEARFLWRRTRILKESSNPLIK